MKPAWLNVWKNTCTSTPWLEYSFITQFVSRCEADAYACQHPVSMFSMDRALLGEKNDTNFLGRVLACIEELDQVVSEVCSLPPSGIRVHANIYGKDDVAYAWRAHCISFNIANLHTRTIMIEAFKGNPKARAALVDLLIHEKAHAAYWVIGWHSVGNFDPVHDELFYAMKRIMKQECLDNLCSSPLREESFFGEKLNASYLPSSTDLSELFPAEVRIPPVKQVPLEAQAKKENDLNGK